MESAKVSRRDDFQKLLELKKGAKYTIVRSTGMGFVSSVCFELVEVRFEPYAQYRESFLIVAKPQRKRNLVGFRVYNAPGSGELVIWEGYEKPKTDMFGDPETSDTGMVVRQSRYTSCDPRYMIDAFNSVSKEPVFARLPEVDEDVLDQN